MYVRRHPAGGFILENAIHEGIGLRSVNAGEMALITKDSYLKKCLKIADKGKIKGSRI